MLSFMPHLGDGNMLQHGKRPTIASRHGMVAAAHPIAAAAGARMLSNGGNAFDAAAATAATLNIVEPYMSGLGGQGYRDLLRRLRAPRALARLHGPHPAPLSARSAEPPRADPARAGRRRRAGQFRRLVRDGEPLRHEEAARAVRPGDPGGARRLRPDRVQRRGVSRRHRRAARPGGALSRMVEQLSRRHRGRPAQARRGAQAARPRQYARGARRRRARACSTAARSARRWSSA